MSLKKLSLPEIKNFAEPTGFESVPALDALSNWAPGVRYAGEVAGSTVVEILGPIGKDPFTGEGVDGQDVADALRGAGDVLVIMNTLGGSFAQGVTIYNLLRAHAGKVTVKVIGLAASAGSIICMAADDIQMGPASFMMIHNGQGAVAGDRHDMTNAATTLASIDNAIADLYVQRTGKHKNSITQMMDAETLMNASDAIKGGFADRLIDKGQVTNEVTASIAAHPLAAKRFVDGVLARIGVPRSQRREVFAAIKAGPLDPTFQDAADQFADLRGEMAELRNTLKTLGTAAAADAGPAWQVGASANLPLDMSESWDGPGAEKRVLDAHGFDGATPDFAGAKQAFLFHDSSKPNDRASYKDPIADMMGGKLTAVRGGVRAAAARLAQTSDIPAEVRNQAKAVVSHYEEKFTAADGAGGTQNAADEVTLEAGLEGIAMEMRSLVPTN